MNSNSGTLGCAATTWLIAGLVGVLAAAALIAVGSWTLLQGIFAGLVIAAVLGVVFAVVFCRELPPANGAATTATAKPAPRAAAAAAPAA
ncbi:hypothetical protein HKCCE3408_17460, partial [Rhodobacterales bacterium HKCCE3408]|nr:hypothetical protein [Rhodobacterales bacterium HKCCE3408]